MFGERWMLIELVVLTESVRRVPLQELLVDDVFLGSVRLPIGLRDSPSTMTSQTAYLNRMLSWQSTEEKKNPSKNASNIINNVIVVASSLYRSGAAIGWWSLRHGTARIIKLPKNLFSSVQLTGAMIILLRSKHLNVES